MIQVICPVCGAALEPQGAAWRCVQGHCFDVARQGYVNLLTVTQKHSRHPGDTREMVAARRAFLDAGWYAPIAKTLATLCAASARRRLPCWTRAAVRAITSRSSAGSRSAGDRYLPRRRALCRGARPRRPLAHGHGGPPAVCGRRVRLRAVHVRPDGRGRSSSACCGRAASLCRCWRGRAICRG